MESRGGETGGLTILEVLRDFEDRGYRGQFVARDGGIVKCFSCGARNDPTHVRMDSLRRVEGASDPADMALIGALQCPSCGAKGTATFKYGADTTPADSDAMRLIEDVRECMRRIQVENGMAPVHVPDVGLDFNPEQRGPGM